MWAIEDIWAETPFCKNPSAVFSSHPDGCSTILIPTEGLSLKLSSRVTEVFNRFPVQATIDRTEPNSLERKILRDLILHRALVPIEAAHVLARGLTSDARDYSGTKKIPLHDLQPTWALIGSAVDFAQVGDRTSFVGPQLIRCRLSRLPTIQDAGNVTWWPSEGLSLYGLRLAYVAALVLVRGALPVVVGGDHSLTFFMVSAICRHIKNIGVIQFDAHNDLGDVARVRSVEDLTHANVAGHLRSLPLAFLAQVGVRPSQLVAANHLAGCPFYQLVDAEIDLFTLFIQRIAERHQVDAIYISIDLDCLNPETAPQVTTPLPGLVRPESLLQCIEYIDRIAPLACVDIVELTAGDTKSNTTADVAIEIIDVVGRKNRA